MEEQGSARGEPGNGTVSSGPRRGVRAGGADRKAQIIRAAVRLVGRHGVQGTTIARIGQELGLCEMASYRYFRNKAEILVEAHQYLIDRTMNWMRSSSHPSVLERLREVGEAHADMLSSDVEMYSAPMLQFCVTPRGDPFRIEQSKQFAVFTDFLSDLFDEGKRQGSIRDDLDAQIFVHLWIGWVQSEDAHYVYGGERDFVHEPHLRMLDLILREIAARPAT